MDFDIFPQHFDFRALCEEAIGAHGAGETPVLIPNTEVKPSSGDYTALRETSKVPNYTKKTPKGSFLFLDYHDFQPYIDLSSFLCYYCDKILSNIKIGKICTQISQ